MILIYNILSGLVLFMILPYIVLRYKLSAFDKIAIGIKQRLGNYPFLEKGKYILLHASSMGELKTVTRFLKLLKEKFPEKKILVLTMTPYGYKYATEKKIADKVVFAPIDIPVCLERLFYIVSPEMLILVESEMWPNLIFSAKRKGAKICIINARMSDRSFKRYMFIREFVAEILKNVDLIFAREESDRKKFIELGCKPEKVVKTGNMKYDKFTEKKKQIKPREDFGFSATDIIFTAGSTREKEEEKIISVYKKLKPQFGHLKLIIAPRYPERCNEVEKILEKEGVSFVRRREKGTATGTIISDCLLVGTIGELVDIYSISDVIFVGGSIFPGAGGHNMLEPAELGKPVLFGTYVENFKEPAEELLYAKAAIQVNNCEELYENVNKLISDNALRVKMGRKGKEVVANQRGATERNVLRVADLLNSQ